MGPSGSKSASEHSWYRCVCEDGCEGRWAFDSVKDMVLFESRDGVVKEFQISAVRTYYPRSASLLLKEIPAIRRLGAAREFLEIL